MGPTNEGGVIGSQGLDKQHIGVSIRVSVSGSCRVEVGVFD